MFFFPSFLLLRCAIFYSYYSLCLLNFTLSLSVCFLHFKHLARPACLASPDCPFSPGLLPALTPLAGPGKRSKNRRLTGRRSDEFDDETKQGQGTPLRRPWTSLYGSRVRHHLTLSVAAVASASASASYCSCSAPQTRQTVQRSPYLYLPALP
ncbi:hypothetical protein K456DRAFT_45790 [Colletotrichum gloeosporioides 23]|nr:hypothetical protein K456DRAFT_45790 [Colletotrichum gloeosporioides 23]